MPLEDLMQHAVNFGAAGLMGVLWTWERAMSRQRERQLTEAHERLLHDRAQVDVLTDLLERNTRAVIRFERTQAGLRRLLEQLLTQPHRFGAAPHPPPPAPPTSPGGDILHASTEPQSSASDPSPG